MKVDLTEEEMKVTRLALKSAISSCARQGAKGGLPIVVQAFARQAAVLSEVHRKLEEANAKAV